MPNHPTTTLASGAINLADELKVQLVKPANEPPRVLIVWPQHTSISTTANYAEVAAAACRLLAAASTELSRLKANKYR